MKALYHNREVKIWKISESQLRPDWVENALREGKIRWLKFSEIKLQLMKRKNQVPYLGELGEYLIYDPKYENYVIKNQYMLVQSYQLIKN